MFFRLDLWSVQNGEAERREQVFNLVLKLCDRMQAARTYSWRRERNVDPFIREPLGQPCLLKPAVLCLVFAFEILLHCIEQLAYASPVFGRKFAELFADLR